MDHRQADEEVRVALAINGGASLAIWMGGCVTEFDRARRGDGIYGTLGDAFGRRLVIDIVGGTSAGGINAAMLAAAVRWRSALHPTFVRERWIANGDFSSLLRGDSEASPPSLLRGERFVSGLRDAFVALEKNGREHPAEPAQESDSERDLRLRITVTNVAGEQQLFEDAWGDQVVAREYAGCFRFDDEADFTPENLAVAARASSSFPIAFEPLLIDDRLARLAGFGGSFWAVDGGVLDNAPIERVAELIPERPASAQVVRYLVYVVADPGAPSIEHATATSPPPAGAVLASVLSAPRDESVVKNLRFGRGQQSRSDLGASTTCALLGTGDAALDATAGGLWNIYRRRRTILTLQGLIQALHDRGVALDPDCFSPFPEGGLPSLPWVPTTPEALAEVPGSEPWSCGVRPLERLLHSLLDAVRTSVPSARDEQAARCLIGVREKIRAALAALGAARAAHRVAIANALTARERPASRADVVEVAIELFSAGPVAAATRDAVPKAMDAIDAFAAALGALAPTARDGRAVNEDVWRSAFSAGDGDASHRHAAFIRRMLCVEVVRSSLLTRDDIESEQLIQFALMTPDSHCELRDTEAPWRAADKLAGVTLQHFGAFYRAAWRANDFMWGRLDAADRITTLFLDRTLLARAQDEKFARAAAGRLAQGMLVEASRIDERDALAGARRQVLLRFALGPDATEAELADAVYGDLAKAGAVATGALRLRAALVLLAQAAIGKDELEALREVLDDEVHDTRAVANVPSIDTASIGGIRNSIRHLPVGLGLQRGPRTRGDELASPYALNLLARGARVASRLAEQSAPMLGRALQPARLGLVTLGGFASPDVPVRLVALLALLASTGYCLTAARDAAGRTVSEPTSVLSSLAVAFAAVLVLVAASAFVYLRAGFSAGYAWAFRAAAALPGLLLAATIAFAAHAENRATLRMVLGPILHSPLDSWATKAVLAAVALAGTGFVLLSAVPWVGSVGLVKGRTVGGLGRLALLVYALAASCVIASAGHYLWATTTTLRVTTAAVTFVIVAAVAISAFPAWRRRARQALQRG